MYVPEGSRRRVGAEGEMFVEVVGVVGMRRR